MPAQYKYVKRKRHPLAPPSGRLPEHRVVLYDKIGPGPHPCHWCGKRLEWKPEGATITSDGVLTVDHLDEDTWNNDPANLVPSCHTCNVERARDERFEDGMFIVNAEGRRERATERICTWCGQAFLIATKHLKRPGRGRYCSVDCRWNR